MPRASHCFSRQFQVQRLQKLFEEKLIGARAVGVDGISLEKFQSNIEREVEIISRKALGGTYRFSAFKAKFISKGHSSPPRVISIATIRDKLSLRALFEVLREVYPDCITSKPHSYVSEVRAFCRAASKESVFLRVDIRDFYVSIEVDKLMKILSRRVRKKEILVLIEGALRTKTEGFTRGVPQGLSISNILANLYLSDFDREMRQKFAYFRYVDDILFILPDEKVAETAYSLVRRKLKGKYSLVCHDLGKNEKSTISKIEDGIDYLGYRISLGKTKVKDKSVKQFIGRLFKLLYRYAKSNQSASALWRLNLRISGCRFNGRYRGWVHFFQQIDDVKQLVRIDAFILKTLRELNISIDHSRIKKITRAFYEAKYNSEATVYIPNFDQYTVPQMAEMIARIRGISIDAVFGSRKTVEEQFRDVLSRELVDLETDLLLFS